MNIVDPILFQCKCQPLALALCAPNSLFNQVSYRQLERFIHNVGRHAHANGLVRGNVIALFLRDPILHSVMILGLTKAGIVTLSSREQNLPKELTVDAALVDESYPADGGVRAIKVDQSWTTGDGSPLPDTGQPVATADDPCRIILTSGSTGYPKAIMRANRHVLTRVYRLQAAYGNRFPDCSRVFMDVGLSTGIGLTFFIYVLSRGGTLFMRGGRSIDTLDALSAYSVQGMVASPQSLAQMTELFEQNPSLGRSFEVIVSTGSLLTPTLSERVRARLGANVVSSYGSTEAGVAAAGPAAALARVQGAVGYVAPGVAVEIVDQSDEKLPAGREGRVRIRSDCVVDGYIGDTEATQQHFRDRCFYPGDLGVVTPNGMLVLLGREQTLINLGGDKVHPERVESVLTSFAAVQDAAAFAALGPSGVQVLGSAVVWRSAADEAGLREHLRQSLPPGFVPKFFLGVDAIPRTPNGKIDRGRLKELAAQQAGAPPKPATRKADAAAQH
ncbi:MAG: acyl--CoA ligase [Xanthobacteraceae bacterium]|nr:acyl--CoA ligase [Xanthobacteraceae bacterium]